MKSLARRLRSRETRVSVPAPEVEGRAATAWTAEARTRRPSRERSARNPGPFDHGHKHSLTPPPIACGTHLGASAERTAPRSSPVTKVRELASLENGIPKSVALAKTDTKLSRGTGFEAPQIQHGVLRRAGSSAAPARRRHAAGGSSKTRRSAGPAGVRAGLGGSA
eukprot:7040542-Alexandrium_andersonii.AAC.1